MTNIIKLKTPIEHAGKTYSELTFREATTGDVASAEAVGGGDFMQTLAIVSAITDVPLPAIKKISMREFKALAEEVAAIMGESPASPA